MNHLVNVILAYSKQIPWTNVYGLSRSLLAFGTLSTLLFSDERILFLSKENISLLGLAKSASIINKISLFSIIPYEFIDLAKYLAILILILVVIGWRPKITGLLHWWVSVSFISSCIIIDGGDQLTSILTLLLIPICLTDNRKWHWLNQDVSTGRSKYYAILSYSSLIVIRIQIAVLYFSAAVSKMGVTEWANGTAIYYWFQNPEIGLSKSVFTNVAPFVTNSIVVSALTYGTIIFELTLFMLLVINKRFYKYFLVFAIAFHLGIVFLFGLYSFFFAISGALILYLRPLSECFKMPLVIRKLGVLLYYSFFQKLVYTKWVKGYEKY
jgi:antimicrobial peptide system SdpB family protein